jgi:16S rRNA (guanine1516-N2)-methyltransferase
MKHAALPPAPAPVSAALPALGLAAAPGFVAAAAALAAELGIPRQAARCCLQINEIWSLQLDGDPPLKLTLDYAHGPLDWRLRHSSGKAEPVVKAVWGRRHAAPSVFDATAGLARDSLLLAASGCSVCAMEQHPLLFALVRNALQAAANASDAALAASLVRLDYRLGNSAAFLAEQAPGFVDVIYLDPMFPPRPGHAKVKNEMQVLQALHGADSHGHDNEALLALALQKAGSKVVVKRPDYAPPLPGRAPGSSLGAGVNRFDIYPLG